MSHDDDADATLQNAYDVSSIVTAMSAAKRHDPRRSAVGLLAVAQVLVNDDVLGRVVLATIMAEAIGELLSGIALEQLNANAVVDVRR